MHSDIIEAWLDTYRAGSRAEGTIRRRRGSIEGAFRELDLLTATPDQLLAFVGSRTLMPESRKSLVVALRSFYRWAHRRGLVDVDLGDELPTVHVPKTDVQPVPARVLERARAIADEDTSLILDLGARMGLRRGEIAAVHANHVTDFGLRIDGKGGRVRTVPIPPIMRERLLSLTGWAFPGRFSGHRSGDWVADRVGAVMPGYAPHALRHYFATTVYHRTHDLRALQKLLGHASIETTQRYVFVDQQDLEAAILAVA